MDRIVDVDGGSGDVLEDPTSGVVRFIATAKAKKKRVLETLGSYIAVKIQVVVCVAPAIPGITEALGDRAIGDRRSQIDAPIFKESPTVNVLDVPEVEFSHPLVREPVAKHKIVDIAAI